MSKESKELFSKFIKEVSVKKRRKYKRAWRNFVVSLKKADPNLSADSVHEIADILFLNLQNAMSKRQQEIQMISNIMKNMHDTTKSIIQNLR